jgi:hypothetical protein
MGILVGNNTGAGAGGGSVPPSTLTKRIAVTQASDLAGTLDSMAQYFIDGIIDMGNQSIEVPAGGLTLAGYSFDISKLTSSQTNYTMFTSPVGGCGDLLGASFAIEVTGTSSAVYALNDTTGNNSVELTMVNFNNCTSLGTLDGFRQGLETLTGRFGGTPTLTLEGAWSGGYFIDTSIVRALSAGMTEPLYMKGSSFTMQSRFRSNQNIDLPANASFFDFSAVNFPNPSTVQIESALITRNGVDNPADPNVTPNISPAEVPCSWKNNKGMGNTFVGGSQRLTTEITTTINTIGVFETLLGTTTPNDLQHFDTPASGQLRHIGSDPIDFTFNFYGAVDGGQGDDLSLQLVLWDDSASGFVVIGAQTRPVNALSGGRDVAFFGGSINLQMEINDYVFLEVANLTSTTNVTLELDAAFRVAER